MLTKKEDGDYNTGLKNTHGRDALKMLHLCVLVLTPGTSYVSLKSSAAQAFVNPLLSIFLLKMLAFIKQHLTAFY
ncbi:hypothetical protein IID24_03125 [Patescibacteria group bacterium]|nr:hypothetical protein [Patescibacteria group bacterium]